MTGARLKNFIFYNAILVAFIAICIVFTLSTEFFLTQHNLINILRQVSFIGIVALGMTLVIISGGIDLSVGSLLALTGVIVATLLHVEGMPILVAIAITVVAGALMGMVSGVIIAYGDIPPFIVTLGMMTIARGLALIISHGVPVGELPESFVTLGRGTFLGIPLPVIFFILLAIMMDILLKRTRTGRYAYAIGGGEKAAYASGINVKKYKIFFYMILGALSAFSGTLLASRVQSGQPGIAIGYELDAIAACIIGGVSFNGGIGKVWGTVFGVLIIGTINNGLDLMNVQSYYQQLIKGTIIIAAVFVDRKRQV